MGIMVVIMGCTPTAVIDPVGSNDWNPNNYNPEIPTNLEGKTWISPGIIEIGNLYPGAEAEWVIKIHNGNSTATNFIISYRFPNDTKAGYSMPPSSTQLWVTISSPNIFLQPDETKDVLVNIKIPSGAVNLQPKWEFWTSVVEKTGGMLETEMCTRWLVIMR